MTRPFFPIKKSTVFVKIKGNSFTMFFTRILSIRPCIRQQAKNRGRKRYLDYLKQRNQQGNFRFLYSNEPVFRKTDLHGVKQKVITIIKKIKNAEEKAKYARKIVTVFS